MTDTRGNGIMNHILMAMNHLKEKCQAKPRG